MSADGQKVEQVSSATVRFAGDSGDGMQLAGMRFTDASAIFGNDVVTLPDYPSEIRAPVGTVAGVSGFQVKISSDEIHTPGDEVDALVAMNPAAFKSNIGDVRVGGIVIANESEFTKVNLRKAGYVEGYDPMEDSAIESKYKIYKVPISRLTKEELADEGMGAKEVLRCKNMYALGLMYYLYDRPVEDTVEYIEEYFGRKKGRPEVARANIRALKAGYHFGDTVEMFAVRYRVPRGKIEAGKYRRITGNEATAVGLVTAGWVYGKKLCYCSYPITPASDILHALADMNNFGVKVFQAEDEIAGMCAAIGASFGGELGVTGTSGPGLCLKGEAIGLAVMMELPVVIVNVQRGGPSTGLPTKVEQSDLLQGMYGRNGESPIVVLAARSPADCFEMALESVKIALESMVPVMLLTDGYIANGAEPWRIPDPESFERVTIIHPEDGEKYRAYERDEKLSRPWAIPGTEGLEHRIGGLEKSHIKGNVSYEEENHQLMTELRQAKIDRIADRISLQEVEGDEKGELLVLSWGGTYGAVTTAVSNSRKAGKSVSLAHLRYINPMPRNLGEILSNFEKVLVPELNMGQLRMLIRSKYLVDTRGLNKVQGKPLQVHEVEEGIELMLSGEIGDRLYVQPHGHEVKISDQDMEERLGDYSV